MMYCCLWCSPILHAWGGGWRDSGSTTHAGELLQGHTKGLGTISLPKKRGCLATQLQAPQSHLLQLLILTRGMRARGEGPEERRPRGRPDAAPEVAQSAGQRVQRGLLSSAAAATPYCRLPCRHLPAKRETQSHAGLVQALLLLQLPRGSCREQGALPDLVIGMPHHVLRQPALRQSATQVFRELIVGHLLVTCDWPCRV
mmetsp:Transcript_85216/g.244673  ORF Transcript_85216/g.244673 Transcript_85216/m.244673 type:complete len:200 (+) Transcript_85216:3-602(+)